MSVMKDEQLYESRGEVSSGVYADELVRQEWQAAIQALQQVHGDYSHARKQLEDVYYSFSEGEKVISERVRCLLDTVALAPVGISGDKTGARGKCSTLEDIVRPPVASFRAYCFGSFEIYLNWSKLDKWPSLKAKSLLKFLISRRGKPTAKDVLIEALWPNCNPEVGSHNLKSAVYALRQTLGRTELNVDNRAYYPFVLFSEGRYKIAPNLELWVDVDEFEQCWLTGRRLEKDGRIEEATRQYRAAEELYRGDYLENEPYAEWTLIQREALKDTHLAILGKLADFSFKAADYENCIIYCQKILADDMCHEEAYRWLIRCYSHFGQRHRARQWYQICAATLKRELDTVPDHETVALYNQLLQ